MMHRHLVSAWNPSYASNVMDAHLEVLLDFAGKYRRGEVEEEDVYVWWAKVRSPNRQQRLPHLQEILSIDKECDGEGDDDREIHLYLTDYRALYVAHVGEITADDVREDDGEPHVPPYYRDHALTCDCWFRLWDIRRIVSDDTLSVIDELAKLRNTRYHDRPVSIYGGMVDLPLIVTRPDGAQYFENLAREQLTDGKHWAEFDAERVGTGAMERELREDHFGEDAWRALEPATRTFIATGEKVFRDHRSDPAFDFTPVIVEFAKAFEVQCDFLLRRALAGASPKARRVRVDDRTVDVLEHRSLTLAELQHAMSTEHELFKALKWRLEKGDWFAGSLPSILGELADVRNPAAHTKRVSREDATRIRNRHMGVGCRGTFLDLAGVRPLVQPPRMPVPTLATPATASH